MRYAARMREASLDRTEGDCFDTGRPLPPAPTRRAQLLLTLELLGLLAALDVWSRIRRDLRSAADPRGRHERNEAKQD